MLTFDCLKVEVFHLSLWARSGSRCWIIQPEGLPTGLELALLPCSRISRAMGSPKPHALSPVPDSSMQDYMGVALGPRTQFWGSATGTQSWGMRKGPGGGSTGPPRSNPGVQGVGGVDTSPTLASFQAECTGQGGGNVWSQGLIQPADGPRTPCLAHRVKKLSTTGLKHSVSWSHISCCPWTKDIVPSVVHLDAVIVLIQKQYLITCQKDSKSSETSFKFPHC